MTSFTGFDDFIEIFRGGPVTDNRGRRHDGDRLIDQALATFDPSHHEPPLCVGHPAENAPAFGWVRELKKETRDGVDWLLAKFDNVVPEFADLVRRGMFKKRSASFYPDGRLRHVGFLGAAPPAIKGLADIGFDDGDGDVLEFSADEFHSTLKAMMADGQRIGIVARIMRRMREWLIETSGSDTADRIVADWEIEEMTRPAAPLPEPYDDGLSYSDTTTTGGKHMKFSEFLDAINVFRKMGGTDADIDAIPTVTAPEEKKPTLSGGQFSEADIEAAKTQAAKEAREQAATEFAERDAARQRDARKAELKKFIDDGVAAGRIAPAWVKMGLPEFMESLADGDAIAFSESGEKKTPDAWMREFVECLPTLIKISEVATRDLDVGGRDAGSQLDALTKAKLKERPEMSYGAAFSEVQTEHPDLANEYANAINP